MTRTYDDKQIEALETRCEGCSRVFYMTKQARLCFRCRRQLGVPMTRKLFAMTPFSLEMNLGAAYNEAMSLLPEGAW